MLKWQAGPPLLACDVWNLLPSELRVSIVDPLREYVSPLYRRLAMGGAHSVHLLMTVSLYTAGRALFQYTCGIASSSSIPSCSLDSSTTTISNDAPFYAKTKEDNKIDNIAFEDEKNRLLDCPHGVWDRRHHRRQRGPLGHSGYMVDGWVKAVREARRSMVRVVAAMLLFSRERRERDVECWVRQFAAFHGLSIWVWTWSLTTRGSDYPCHLLFPLPALR